MSPSTSISSTFSARATRPTDVARLRWKVLGATVGTVLAAVSLVAASPSGPGKTSTAPSLAVPAVVTSATSARTGSALTVGDREPRPDVAPVAAPVPVAPPGPVAVSAPAAAPTPRAVASDAAVLPRSRPTRVRIPAIDVDSDLMDLGLENDGQMEVPPGAFPAGWYTGAPTPGELGPAILAGHVDHGGTAGVFHRLRELEPGDTVEVARQDGSTAVFRVTRVEQHRKDAFPTAAVYGDLDHAGLRLITCGGSFDDRARSYMDNIVVFAALDPGDVGAGDG